jgi:hypothetical protein
MIDPLEFAKGRTLARLLMARLVVVAFVVVLLFVAKLSKLLGFDGVDDALSPPWNQNAVVVASDVVP